MTYRTEIEETLAAGFVSSMGTPNVKIWKCIRKARKSMDPIDLHEFKKYLEEECGIETTLVPDHAGNPAYSAADMNIIDETKFTMFVLKWSE